MRSVVRKLGPGAIVGLLLLFGAPFVAVAEAVTVPGDYPTIQAAINAVLAGSLPDGTTIDVQPGTYAETLSVKNTNRSLIVRGVGGAAGTIIDAAGRGVAALQIIQATGVVAFKGLTFRNGTSSIEGGGFLIRQSSPALVDCVFELNSAFRGGGGALFTSNATFTRCIIRNNTSSHFGGGVYIVQGSKPVFAGCDIIGNKSGTGPNGVGNNGAGGGVFSHDSSPTFRGARVNANTSMFAAGGVFHQGVFGSANGRAILTIEDSELADNVSTPFPGAPNPAEGGGMHVEDFATGKLTRVRVLRNRAGTGGGLNAYRGRYDVVDSVVDSNQATTAFGGGVAATSNNATAAMPGSVVNLTTTLVRNNTSPVGGGVTVVGDNFSSQRATLSLAGSVVSGNQSQSQGGGVLVNRTVATVSNSLIINNTVTGGANPYGGGLLVTTTSAATITGSTIAHNTAGQLGGGLFVNDNSTIAMSESQIYDNTAGNRGGGVFIGGGQSGTIQNSVIADNVGSQFNSQITEDTCSSVTYPSNLITAPAFFGCASLQSRAPNTDSTSKPRFAKLLAVPSTGTSLTLAWSVARATSVTISGVGTFGMATGTVDVSPTGSATYTLTAAASAANGGAYGPVSIGFAYVLPPLSIPRSVAGDFNGDGRADVTVYRPSNGIWYTIIQVSAPWAA